ncbi:MAG: fatty acid desaturase [Bacteriovoracaceae bacterium]
MTIANGRFILLHILTLIGALYFGVSPISFAFFVFFYYFRTLAVAISYHRFFSHRSFKSNRFIQFVLGCWGASAGQRGPLWWASLHRHHHQFSDQKNDIHSPKHQTFWDSHVGWVLKPDSRKLLKVDYVQDLMKFPELLWLEKYSVILFLFSLISLLPLTYFFRMMDPDLSYGQMFIWAGLMSFLASSHATLTVNSVFHMAKNKEEKAGDYSLNLHWAWLFIMGENLHNNHHCQPNLCHNLRKKNDFDPIYLFLVLAQKCKLISHLKC